jgi:hypothetical protein
MNDGFQDAGEDIDAPAKRLIQGELVKFTNTATWVTRSGEELSRNLELVAVDVSRVVQRWEEGRPVESRVLQPGEKLPDLEELNATGWQSYGDAARAIIANSSEQFGWLAPAPVEQASGIAAPTTVAAPSSNIEELKTMSFGLAIVRQNVDQLITAQEQMGREITKLQAAEQDVLQKISEPSPRPTATPTPKGTSPTPSQAPVR